MSRLSTLPIELRHNIGEFASENPQAANSLSFECKDLFYAIEALGHDPIMFIWNAIERERKAQEIDRCLAKLMPGDIFERIKQYPWLMWLTNINDKDTTVHITINGTIDILDDILEAGELKRSEIMRPFTFRREKFGLNEISYSITLPRSCARALYRFLEEAHGNEYGIEEIFEYQAEPIEM